MADELTIKLDNSQVRATVEDAILRLIDADAQQELIRTALAHLTKPYDRPYSYGSDQPKSPLAQAFVIAVDQVVTQTARQLLAEGTPLRSDLDKLISDSLTAFITEKDSVFTLAIGRGIAEALRTRQED